jgi:tRNA modification GTPase
LGLLVADGERGSFVRHGLRVALVGRPNVGKSSLLNLLSRRERAIVTDLPGTTRDLLESEIVLDGVPITLLDTAGIRATCDAVEQLGIARSREALASADLVLLLFDLAHGWSEEDQDLFALIPEGVPCLRVGNKADLPLKAEPVDESVAASVALSVADVCLSAVTGEGEQALVRAVLERCGALGEQPLLLALNQRQSDLAVTAAEALARSEQVAADGLPWDFWTIDLRQAIRSLGEITGEQLTESVLDRIFSRFCIGK